MEKNKKEPVKSLTKKDETTSKEKEMPAKWGRMATCIIGLVILSASVATCLHFGGVSHLNDADSTNVIEMRKESIGVKRNLASQSSMSDLEYPLELAPRGDTVDIYMDNDGETETKVEDPYRSLEDTQSPSTIKWVNA